MPIPLPRLWGFSNTETYRRPTEAQATTDWTASHGLAWQTQISGVENAKITAMSDWDLNEDTNWSELVLQTALAKQQFTTTQTGLQSDLRNSVASQFGALISELASAETIYRVGEENQILQLTANSNQLLTDFTDASDARTLQFRTELRGRSGEHRADQAAEKTTLADSVTTLVEGTKQTLQDASTVRSAQKITASSTLATNMAADIMASADKIAAEQKLTINTLAPISEQLSVDMANENRAAEDAIAAKQVDLAVAQWTQWLNIAIANAGKAAIDGDQFADMLKYYKIAREAEMVKSAVDRVVEVMQCNAEFSVYPNSQHEAEVTISVSDALVQIALKAALENSAILGSKGELAAGQMMTISYFTEAPNPNPDEIMFLKEWEAKKAELMATDLAEFSNVRPIRPKTTLEKVNDFASGFLDGLTGGITRDIREAIGGYWAYSVDTNSAYYVVGNVTGSVVLIVASIVAAPLSGGGSLLGFAVLAVDLYAMGKTIMKAASGEDLAWYDYLNFAPIGGAAISRLAKLGKSAGVFGKTTGRVIKNSDEVSDFLGRIGKKTNNTGGCFVGSTLATAYQTEGGIALASNPELVLPRDDGSYQDISILPLFGFAVLGLGAVTQGLSKKSKAKQENKNKLYLPNNDNQFTLYLA